MSFFALFTLVASASSTEGPSAEEKALRATIAEIQRECLRAYPAHMLQDMTDGEETIPETVETAPEGQMQFLSKELTVEKGLFYPSLLEEMLPALQRFLKPGDRFLDLGSGDGRALFLANVLGARATGIEYDPELVAVSRRAAEALGDRLDAERLEILQADFFTVPWSGYDVIFYFDLSSFEQDRVRAKLRRELDPDALLIVGHEQAPFPGLELVVDMRPMRVYRQGDDRKHPDR